MVSDPLKPGPPGLSVIAFSYDRPLQAWGLVRSLLDQSDVHHDQIAIIAKSSSERFRSGYDVLSRELGCRIHHETPAPSGWRRRFHRESLYDLILRLSEGSRYVSFAVDDMMYFQPASFSDAIARLDSDPEVCLWSWRIGSDLQPNACLELRGDHWRAGRRRSPMPYQLCFHTDGCIYRRSDLQTWLGLVPLWNRRTLTLNGIEGRLSRYRKPKRAGRVRVGPVHAGPLRQACVTWQVNKVVDGGSEYWSDVEATKAAELQGRFEAGERLDYEPFYDTSRWIGELNSGWPHAPTHIAPTPEAAERWLACVGRGRE